MTSNQADAHERDRIGEVRPASEAVIRIDRLTKRYGDQTAVDGLSLDVPEGAIFGLLGENGAGKTTTIQTLLGLVRPDSGRVEVLGLDPSRDKQGLEVRRRIGYVPEVPVLYDTMTVAQIGWFASGFHPGAGGSTAAFQDRYNELIKGFDLPEKRKISALSKGMRAKVSLSLALAGEPALLILDEPTSGLDVLVRREFLESMIDLAGAGKTVLLSSHQIGEVERVASHVALVHKGKLILTEPLDTLKARTFLLSATFGSRDHPEAPPSELPVELIDAADAPRQARWLVRARDRAACEAVRSMPGVETLEIEHPGLEEIYIGYMRGRRPDRASSPPPLAVHVA
jgi:ABC-2 type transport system ATP-binding protein